MRFGVVIPLPAGVGRYASAVSTIRDALLLALDEGFENPQENYLYAGESFYETLDGITAVEASRAAAPLVGTIAAQVNHAAFCLNEIVRTAANGPRPEHVDFAGTWAIREVGENEWNDLRDELRTQYARTRQYVAEKTVWSGVDLIVFIALVAHCAYHPGEVRQAISVIRDG